MLKKSMMAKNALWGAALVTLSVVGCGESGTVVSSPVSADEAKAAVAAEKVVEDAERAEQQRVNDAAKAAAKAKK